MTNPAKYFVIAILGLIALPYTANAALVTDVGVNAVVYVRDENGILYTPPGTDSFSIPPILAPFSSYIPTPHGSSIGTGYYVGDGVGLVTDFGVVINPDLPTAVFDIQSIYHIASSDSLTLSNGHDGQLPTVFTTTQPVNYSIFVRSVITGNTSPSAIVQVESTYLDQQGVRGHVFSLNNQTSDSAQVVTGSLLGNTTYEFYHTFDAGISPRGGGGAFDGLSEIELMLTSPVPVPAAVWLFVSGLGVIGFLKRRQIIG